MYTCSRTVQISSSRWSLFFIIYSNWIVKCKFIHKPTAHTITFSVSNWSEWWKTFLIRPNATAFILLRNTQSVREKVLRIAIDPKKTLTTSGSFFNFFLILSKFYKCWAEIIFNCYFKFLLMFSAFRKSSSKKIWCDVRKSSFHVRNAICKWKEVFERDTIKWQLE